MDFLTLNGMELNGPTLSVVPIINNKSTGSRAACVAARLKLSGKDSLKKTTEGLMGPWHHVQKMGVPACRASLNLSTSKGLLHFAHIAAPCVPCASIYLPSGNPESLCKPSVFWDNTLKS